MKITKLEFNDFRVYEGYHEFYFDEGVNLILGKNGKGKSSFIYALRLLLLNINSSKNLTEIINWSGATSFKIACEFEISTKRYRSEFTLELSGNTSKTNRKLFVNGGCIREGSKDVAEYLNNLFDPVLTDNALFLKQNSNNIVNVVDSERREIIKKMKDIDYSFKVKQKIDPRIEGLKEQILIINKEIYSLESKKYDQKILKELPFLGSKYNELVENSKILNSEIILIKNKESDLELKQNKLESLENKIKIDRKTITNNNSAISENLKEITIKKNNYLKDCDKLNLEIEKANSDISKFEKGFDCTEIKKDYIKNKDCLIKNLNSLEDELKDITIFRIQKYNETEINNVKALATTCALKIKDLDIDLDNMKKGKCPTCGKAYESKSIIETSELLKKEEVNLRDLNNKIIELEKEKILHEKKVEDNTRNKFKKIQLTDSINYKKEEVKKLESQFEKEKQSGIKRNEELLISSRKNLEFLKNQIFSLNTICTNEVIQLDKDNNSFFNSSLNLQNKIDNEYSLEISSLKEEIKNIYIGDIEEKEKVLRNINEKIAEYETIKNENTFIQKYNMELLTDERMDKDKLGRKKSYKDRLTNSLLEHQQAKIILLKDFPNYIISQDLQSLEEDINYFIDSVYHKSLNISFKQNKDSIELKYNNNIKNPNLKNCKGGLSGCESRLVQIAFTNSFNEQLDLKCLFLDEPDSSIDEENAEKLYEVISGLESKFDQLFIISHNKKLINYIIKNNGVGNYNIIEL